MAKHMFRVRMETVGRMVTTVGEFATKPEAQAFATERRQGADALAGLKRYYVEADPERCPHPPARLYSGVAPDAQMRRSLWVACCDCGTVLR